MRQLNASLPVQLDGNGRPLAVLCHGEFLQVSSIIDSWQWAGDWVNGVSERNYWLVAVDGGGVLEIYEEQDTGQWVLSAMQD